MSKHHLFTSSAGIRHDWIQEETGWRIESTQDVTPILDANKAKATHNDGYSQGREMRRVASIPYIVGLQWLNEEGWWFEDPQHADRLARKLNDPDWQHLRTAPGRVGLSNGELR